MKLSDYVFDYLKQYTDTVFLVPGGGAAHLVDSVSRYIHYVPCVHEQGAGFAALGYAMSTGKLGVCLVTSGPGVTNAITPCAAAWMDSVPVLFISGQCNSYSTATVERTKGSQEIATVPLVMSIVKDYYEPHGLYKFTEIFDRVVLAAMTPRHGPSWVSLPLDIQAKQI